MRRPTLLQSISITAAANIEDEVHLQKFHSDVEMEDKGAFHNKTWMRSKSTIETSRELMGRVTRITSPRKFKQLQQDPYGKR